MADGVCGIFAIWSAAGGLAAPDLTVPVRALSHRGPDGRGTWCAPSGRAALGHTRLAVVGLATGAQPMHTCDGRYHLAATGEFYGYQEIQAELRRSGRRLSTGSDSEIALHLYAESGPRALDRLRGEFAFVIWDERDGELFAARDRFGIKPLYYAHHRGRLYLSSEIKALLAAGVPARWDRASLADHLTVCCLPDRTLFHGIRQVPPGCYLRAGEGGTRITTYWDLDYPLAAELPETAESPAHLETIESAVCAAVRTRMQADVGVAYHLSGGLDSTTVVAVAARHADPATFTVRFRDDASFDEGQTARRTAEAVGARHTEIVFAESDFAGQAAETVARGEMIQENSHGAARLMQSQAIRAAGYKVVMAGEGGDEVFAGYPQSRKDLAYSLSPQVRARARDSYAKLNAHGPAGHLRFLLSQLDFVPNWMLDRHMTVTLPLTTVLRDEFARELEQREPCAALFSGQGSAQLAGRTPYHQAMYLFCKTWLCNYILAAERLDMAHGLEVRLPFFDHHLFAAAKWAPLDWYVRGDSPKPLLREAMRRYLPDEVYRGGKQGFFAPPAVGDDRVLMRLRELVRRGALDGLPFFDPAKIDAMAQRLTGLPAARRAPYDKAVQFVTGVILMTETFHMSSPG